jgi:tetratricopeptide (TPR) repeat protein
VWLVHLAQETQVRKVAFAVVAIVLGSAPALADMKSDCEARDGAEAIKACTELIRLNAKDASFYYNRGMAHFETPDYDSAIADLSKAIEIDTRYGDALNQRGLAYRHKGDLDRAIADYSRAIEIDPQLADAYNNRGNAYGAKGDYDRSVADYSQAIELDPEESSYARSLGLAHYGKGDFSAAAADMLHAIELDDDGYAMLFRYLARTRAGEEATEELEANIGRLETKAWPYAVAELYLGSRSAEATFDAVSDDDERCEAQFYIGQWHMLKHSVPDARKKLEIATGTCPKTSIEYEVAVAELKRLKP